MVCVYVFISVCRSSICVYVYLHLDLRVPMSKQMGLRKIVNLPDHVARLLTEHKAIEEKDCGLAIKSNLRHRGVHLYLTMGFLCQCHMSRFHCRHFPLACGLAVVIAAKCFLALVIAASHGSCFDARKLSVPSKRRSSKGGRLMTITTVL